MESKFLEKFDSRFISHVLNKNKNTSSFSQTNDFSDNQILLAYISRAYNLFICKYEPYIFHWTSNKKLILDFIEIN